MNSSTISTMLSKPNDSVATLGCGEREEAIPLITFDTISKKFFINENAEQFLKKLDSPLGVISVAGMYRTGKSYLLNRMLLNRSNGFSVGPTINPCTKGLWIWPKPLSGFSTDGTPLNVLIIDTEGIGATDEDQNHDNKIFTLGLLLSSYFIFNSLGTIDENAIQNLSFIVNITKNIQLNNSKNDLDDLKEISKLLPSFMWVLRDFTLRLVDVEGKAITSKEYLEKSLEQQKGSSEAAETKNKIRSLIKEFFRERDCVTLVRPLTEEINLQNLSKMDQSKLRSEFLEQIAGLRKMVLHRVKPKLMHGKALNGEMFCNVMRSYVNAINSGAVPVIENAWSFMCKNECNRAKNNALTHYIESMNENIKAHFPVDESELTSQHKEAKKYAFSEFSTNALGVFFDEYSNELKNAIKEKHLQYVIENEKETKKCCESFITINYAEIKFNLLKHAYKSFSEFKSDVDRFISLYMEKAPSGPYRRLFIYEFIIREILVNSEVFVNNLIEELELITSNNKEDIKNYTNTITELKVEFSKESAKNFEIIKKFEIERNDLVMQDKSNKDLLSSVLKEKETGIKELNETIEALKKEYEKKIIEMKSKLEINEESTKEAERTLKVKETEFDKCKLLFEGKIKNMEKNIEDVNNKHSSEIKSIKNERIITTKDKGEKYETQIKTLTDKFSKMQEENIKLDTKLLEKEKRMKNESLKSEEHIDELKKKIEEINDILHLTEDEVKSLENKLEEEKEKGKLECGERVKELKDELETLSIKLKESEDRFLNLRRETVREISILKQNLEFAEMQIKELKILIGDDKKSYEILIKLLEDKNSALLTSQEDLLHQINEVKLSHLNEINKFRSDAEEKESQLKFEIDNLNSLCVDWEGKFISKVEEFQKESQLASMRLLEGQKQLGELKIKLDNCENEKNKLIEEHRLALEHINSAMNQKIENMLRQCRTEIEENNERNEKDIIDIRRHYEVEKENLDFKLNEEKEKMEAQLIDIEKDYIEKNREWIKMKDERIDDLEQTVQHLNLTNSEYVTDVEQELAVKNQQIDSLSKYLNDTKESLTSIQLNNENMMQSHLNRFREEKTEINNQVDRLINEIKDKERENGSLIEKISQAESTIIEIKNQKIEIKLEAKQEKSELNDKISTLYIKSQVLNDDLVSVKSEYNKDMALKNQEIEFNNSKINELQLAIDDYNLKAEEKAKQIREVLEAEYTEKMEGLQEEKSELEAKLVQRRKEIKELEITHTNDKNMLEKERAVLIEKLSNVNRLKEEMAEALEKERKTCENKIQQIKSESKRESELTVKENEMMRNKLRKLETDYNELHSVYEKDNNLWTTKFTFLEEQKNQARSDLTECQRKFESQIENLSKKGLIEKDKLESMQNALNASMELKYKSYYSNIQDKYSSKLEEVNIKRKVLENENKTLKEKLNEKISNSNLNEMEKKLYAQEQNEMIIKKEYNELNNEKEQKIKELSFLLEKERIFNKEKTIELENKLREYESKRSNMNVDTIKEKALSEKDKQNMKNDIENLNARIVSLERYNMKIINENKDLIKENEKLKKGSKFSSNNSSNFYLPKLATRFITANKENRNSNTSFEVRGYDNLDDLSNLGKMKFSSKNSQRSDNEDDMSSTSHN